MRFCYENNIILCRLPSHTSHKLQPCDVGIFGPLKIAYREEVEPLYRGGSNMIGKQHFTVLYDRARRKAMTSWNIISRWSKMGLRPFNPERVLKDIQKPDMAKHCSPLIVDGDKDSFPLALETPKTSESLASLRRDIETNIDEHKALDARTKLSIPGIFASQGCLLILERTFTSLSSLSCIIWITLALQLGGNL